jgi:hypothetical protein
LVRLRTPSNSGRIRSNASLLISLGYFCLIQTVYDFQKIVNSL